MTRAIFWKQGTNDGCSFYRCDEPARALTERGHVDAMSTRVMPDSLFMDADVIVGQRITEDNPTELWRMLSTGELGVRPKLIYEIDDDLLNVPESFGLLHAHHAAPQRRLNIAANLARADVVTTTNAHLAERVQRYTDAEVHVIPNYVPERFVLPAMPERPEQGDGPTIGWAGSDSHREDFEQVIIPLRKVLRAHDVDVHIVGPDYTPRLRSATPREIHYSKVRHTGWIDGVPAYYGALDFHVGIAPLVDNVFNRSKSDVKLKEYAARGIASVASRVGPYRHTATGSEVPHYGVGAPGGTHSVAAWNDMLEYVVENPHAVADMAKLAHKWATAHTLEAHIGEWEKVIRP
jgi:glycosyltransferase involved in cell wall biosynthesis